MKILGQTPDEVVGSRSPGLFKSYLIITKEDVPAARVIKEEQRSNAKEQPAVVSGIDECRGSTFEVTQQPQGALGPFSNTHAVWGQQTS
jgi:hypothetical protein